MDFIILLYHGVTEHLSSGIENNSKKHISFIDFKDQMKWLKKHANIDKIMAEKLIELERDEKLLRRKADLIYENYTIAEQAIALVNKLKKRNLRDNEISSELSNMSSDSIYLTYANGKIIMKIREAA